MKVVQLIKKVCSCLILLGVANFAAAQTDEALVCPSGPQMQAFHNEFSFPYEFDQKTNHLKFFTISDLTVSEDEYNEKAWYLFAYPIAVQLTDNLQPLVGETIAKLEPVMATPFRFNVADDIQLTFCVYHLPGQDGLNAFAFYDEEDLDDAHLKMKHVSRHQGFLDRLKRMG